MHSKKKCIEDEWASKHNIFNFRRPWHLARVIDWGYWLTESHSEFGVELDSPYLLFTQLLKWWMWCFFQPCNQLSIAFWKSLDWHLSFTCICLLTELEIIFFFEFELSCGNWFDLKKGWNWKNLSDIIKHRFSVLFQRRALSVFPLDVWREMVVWRTTMDTSFRKWFYSCKISVVNNSAWVCCCCFCIST